MMFQIYVDYTSYTTVLCSVQWHHCTLCTNRNGNVLMPTLIHFRAAAVRVRV